MANHVKQSGDSRLDKQVSRSGELIRARAEAQGKARDVAAGQPVLRQSGMPDEGYPSTLAAYLRRNKVYIFAVVAVVVLVAIGIVVAGAFMREAENDEFVEVAGYSSPYDWTKLDRVGGRFKYVVDGSVKSRLGIDVSDNQHEIDWQSVAADGIDFAMIRLGYRGATLGDLHLDGYFWSNLDGARNAGLECGVYFFSQARTVQEAVEEADYVISCLNGISLDYPVAFDSEEISISDDGPRTGGLSNDEMTAIAEAFCNRIEAAGYATLVYGNKIDLARYNHEEIEDRDIWWAEYDAPIPAANLDIYMWQYSNAGEVAGISTAVDMDIDLSGVLDEG